MSDAEANFNIDTRKAGALSVLHAMATGYEYARDTLDEGNSIVFKKVPSSLLRTKTPYRYENDLTGTNASKFGRAFLMNADPSVTGEVSTQIVDLILKKLEHTGYNVEYTNKSVLITPKAE